MGCFKSFDVVCKVSIFISPCLKLIKTYVFCEEYLATKIKATMFWDCF